MIPRRLRRASPVKWILETESPMTREQANDLLRMWKQAGMGRAVLLSGATAKRVNP